MTALSGKSVMIVGGSRGIGSADVSSFAAEGGKGRFTYAGSEAAAKAVATDTGAMAVKCDAAKREELATAIRDAGPIDILVYNAGLLVAGDPLTLDPDAAERMIDVNVRGAYFESVAAARAMPTADASS
jgi:cyclic-di-GMP-binding biofilm dispersal mediator protein